jgi:hypothetical protein
LQSFLTDHVNRTGYFTDAIKRANECWKFPSKGKEVFDVEVSNFQKSIEQKFVELIKPLQRLYDASTTKKRPAGPLASTIIKKTRGDALIGSLEGGHPQKILKKFENLKEKERKLVLAKLLNNAN